MDYDEIIDTKDDSKVNLKVSFGSCVKYVNSEDFKEANISCSFGAMQVYFDNAVTFKDAVINLDVSFAGVELYVPRTWKIVNKVNVILGAVEEKNNSNSDASIKVTIRGNVSLSKVEIKYI